MSDPSTVPVCYRHPDRETRLGCSSCGRPICVDCVRRASVGQLCPECAAERGGQRVIRREEIGAQGSARTPVAMTILGVCVGIFALGFLSPEFRGEAFFVGAQDNHAVVAGEWYRLVTATFLHADMAHLLFNMLALYIFGPQLERQVGSLAFASLYFGSALAGGAVFYALEPAGTAVGASGAIFGLFGAWLVAAFRNRHTDWGRAGFKQLLVLLGINMALPLFIPRIAWEAHAGGLVSGLLIAALWTLPALRARPWLRALAGASLGAIALALVAV